MKNQTIQNAIDTVQSAFPSIYTKDDVVQLLNSIDIVAADAAPATALSIDSLTDVANNMNRDIDYYVDTATQQAVDNAEADTDNCSFEINYNNQVELEAFTLEGSSIRSYISDQMEAYVQHFMQAVIEATAPAPAAPVTHIELSSHEEAFNRYKEVQQAGEHNMASYEARDAAALENEEHVFIIANYDALEALFTDTSGDADNMPA